MEHLTEEQLERWVAGVLDDDASALVIEHVRACRDCEARLQAEARLEGALRQTLRASTEKRRVTRLRRGRLAVAAAGLALAASLLVWLRLPGPAPAPERVTVPIYEAGHPLPVEAFTAYAPFDLAAPRYESGARFVPGRDFAPLSNEETP